MEVTNHRPISFPSYLLHVQYKAGDDAEVNNVVKITDFFFYLL